MSLSLKPDTNSESLKRVKHISDVFNKITACCESVGTLTTDKQKDMLNAIQFLYQTLRLDNVALLASAILRLRNRPYSISRNFYPMEPLFDVRMPRQQLWMTGRQVSKSTSTSANLCLRSLIFPYYNILALAPRIEQSQRFSAQVRALIAESFVRPLLERSKSEQSVARRVFPNGSTLYFSFAFLSCDRVRGISANEVDIDEIQGLNWDFLPVISSCMDASPYGSRRRYTGTPLTTDNTIEALWRDSSQGEWAIPCDCGHVNIPRVSEGAMDMIRPEGLSCCKCSRLINPRRGFWQHMVKAYVGRNMGYHVPQIIMPMHWESPVKWEELILKRDTWAPHMFMNEIMGESYDVGARVITLDDIRRASNLGWANTIENALAQLGRYEQPTLAVDWGGHGEEETSLTGISVVAKAGKELHVLYMEQLPLSMRPEEEAKRVIELFLKFKCRWLAHDYRGAGMMREVILVQSGIPTDIIMPIEWVQAAHNIITFKDNWKTAGRQYYSVDKSKVLGICLSMIRLGQMRFPTYESCGSLTSQWCHYFEDKKETARGREFYMIRREPKKLDDVAQSHAFAAIQIWHLYDEFPSLARKFGVSMSPEEEASLEPASWESMDSD